MKKRISMIPAAFAALLLAAGCEHKDVLYDVDFNVVLDQANTFSVGEPVKFNFDGQVDNILFYSGEPGAKYEFRDRYEVDKESMESASMELQIQAQYGRAGALEVYVTNKFDGLAGNDGNADRAMMKSLFDGQMSGWERIDYKDGPSGKWISLQIPDLKEYMDNFCIAFHWNQPALDGKNAQRTYRVNGELKTETKDGIKSSISLGELNLKTVSMNEQHDPYRVNAGNGSIILNDSFDIFFKGVAKTELDFPLNAWCISTPQALNKVPNDKGQVIKDLQNYMGGYEYTYSAPGTYMATFVVINSNYVGSDRKVIEIPVTIVDKPLK